PVPRARRHPGEREVPELLQVFGDDPAALLRRIDAVEVRGASAVDPEIEPVQVYRVLAGRSVEDAPANGVAQRVRESRRVRPDLSVEQKENALVRRLRRRVDEPVP